MGAVAKAVIETIGDAGFVVQIAADDAGPSIVEDISIPPPSDSSSAAGTSTPPSSNWPSKWGLSWRTDKLALVFA